MIPEEIKLKKALMDIRSLANQRTSSHAWDCHCSICKIYDTADKALDSKPTWEIQEKISDAILNA